MKNIIHFMLEEVKKNSTPPTEDLIFDQSTISIVRDVWGYFALVGICATLIYFLLEMNRKYALEGGDMTFKSFFAPFLKLIIAVIIVMNGGKIVSAILELSNGMVIESERWNLTPLVTTAAQENPPTPTTVADNLDKAIKSYGLMAQLGMLLGLFLAWIITFVLKFVWMYKILLYKLEMLFRIGIAPISLADVYSGQNSTALRYLKGILALGVYGLAIMILPTIAENLAVANFVSAGEDENVFGMIAAIIQLAVLAPFAALTCATAARTAAKEALGA